MTTITRPGVGHRTAHDPGDPLVTSHCPFCGSGQVVGRSDGTISCDFCGQAYIVRVQPAFPGMPQMPMGPGAASDVGPDGGLMDPSMIGPDGMPADEEGGPPPADATEDPAEGEEGGPPDEDGGEEEESAPPPPKGKKKAARRYRGVQGQSLTEDQFVRHIAVVASGADPKVMALLRSTARRKTAAVISEGTTPYRTLPTGHQVSVGRHGRDWYGMITHPESSQVHFMHVGDREPEDVHPEIERQLARDSGTRAFLHATDPTVTSPDAYREHPGEWYRGTGPGHSPSDFRPAIGSRRPFGRASHKDADVRDLASLRAHMKTDHGFDVAGMIPQRTLLGIHEDDHTDTDPIWYGSPDSSRIPGFTAMLSTHTYGDPAMMDAEQRGAESFERAGLGSADGWGPTHLETGHMLQASYDPGSGWGMHIFHPSSADDRGNYRKVISTTLGHDHDAVGHHAVNFLRRRDVLAAMTDQMKPGEWDNGGGGAWFERVHRHM